MSLVDPWNLIREIYHGEIISKIFCLENYTLYGVQLIELQKIDIL